MKSEKMKEISKFWTLRKESKQGKNEKKELKKQKQKIYEREQNMFY